MLDHYEEAVLLLFLLHGQLYYTTLHIIVHGAL